MFEILANIPCNECLVFPACKYKVIYNDMIYFLDLMKCELFREWYGPSYNLKKNRKVRQFFKVENILRVVYSGRN